jgi:hypothetical protein
MITMVKFLEIKGGGREVQSHPPRPTTSPKMLLSTVGFDDCFFYKLLYNPLKSLLTISNSTDTLCSFV